MVLRPAKKIFTNRNNNNNNCNMNQLDIEKLINIKHQLNIEKIMQINQYRLVRYRNKMWTLNKIRIKCKIRNIIQNKINLSIQNLKLRQCFHLELNKLN